MKLIMSLILFVCLPLASASEDRYLVTAGIGIEEVKIGDPSLRSSMIAELAKRGVFLTQTENTVSQILIPSEEFSTSMGLKVGGSLQTLLEMKGCGEISDASIWKGGRRVGSAGLVISYKGIAFNVNENRISAMIIAR